jgi:hypothetical protein
LAQEKGPHLPKPPLPLRAFARGDYRTCTWNVQQALDRVGAVVLYANPLGSMALALVVELETVSFPALASALDDVDVHLDGASRARLQPAAASADSEEVRTLLLHVDFAHDGPDERTEIPHVPG